jgi:hypothetical protein
LLESVLIFEWLLELLLVLFLFNLNVLALSFVVLSLLVLNLLALNLLALNLLLLMLLLLMLLLFMWLVKLRLPPLLPPLAKALVAVSVKATIARVAINLVDEVFIVLLRRELGWKSIELGGTAVAPLHKLLRAW